MLQQTGVERVIDRWVCFLDRFPTPAACAASTPSAVIAEWSGLGYNRRALHLHRSAVMVVERHGGVVPFDLRSLLALPGVGPYTARAVLAFAHEADVAVVDTNVARVLARWMGRRLTSSEVQRLADSSVPAGEGWGWNQVLLDLGAGICRARQPSCAKCPLEFSCSWRGKGPDPAVGSAGVAGRQTPFEGSDRQGRGRLVATLASGPLQKDHLPAAMGWPNDPKRASRVVAGLLEEGLVVEEVNTYALPGE
ncbi:MAG TPA: A/G-specific adenine glycosylase [Acidimicrobiaceae bacterium]|nr:A/G-specific adenine glycosylase [Acidimicrobiaceae bacterium]